ncbi:sigma-70 family RNA polymerase sigma factor [Mucilaginibacter sabulilitoris]|uniref:Sigma-70 family RNA polymerase sigma factor n=1 Tax=Mucilaginibacter sabulilitoris TaxID=1173583 RepID=A0ABZ0TVN7_9SPHI|nr:sigma-70 family RNA polymerase sigma factor [Mucilaginibacter sabulilitoris]WPU96547.1 sigma-70 family RNA polymerase sigma factor [Mucilaginibacter sabulilitoris]
MTTALMSDDKNSHIIHTIKAYGKSLLGFIRRRVKSDADAEDILQDVWYQFSTVINSEPIEQTSAWLYKVARNKITDKHKKKTETLLDDMLTGGEDEDDTVDLKAILFTETSTPETEYLRNLFWDQLFMALDELPCEQKDVFIWHELDDLSFQEIADTTGEKIQTLVSRKRYAVLHLRQRLQQLYKEITEY